MILLFIRRSVLYALDGHPYDNGQMLLFLSILKRDEIYLQECHTLTEVQAAIDWYISFYHGNRISNVAPITG